MAEAELGLVEEDLRNVLLGILRDMQDILFGMTTYEGSLGLRTDGTHTHIDGLDFMGRVTRAIAYLERDGE